MHGTCIECTYNLVHVVSRFIKRKVSSETLYPAFCFKYRYTEEAELFIGRSLLIAVSDLIRFVGSKITILNV